MRTTPVIATAAIGTAIAATLALGAQSTTIGKGEKTCILRRGADCTAVVHRWRVEHHGDLRGIHLLRADIRGADLRGADLRKGDLRGAVLRHADLTDARLRGADLRAAGTAHVILRGADARGARFGVLPATSRKGNAREMWDSGTGLAPDCLPKCANAQISDPSMGMDGSGADFTNSNWTGADVESSNFAGANFTGATMESAFPNSDFSHANLSSVWAIGGSGQDFQEVGGMAFPYRQGDFTDSNMTGANLTRGHFDGGWFTNANLTNADFFEANISGTDFSGATFHNTRCPNGQVTNTGC